MLKVNVGFLRCREGRSEGQGEKLQQSFVLCPKMWWLNIYLLEGLVWIECLCRAYFLVRLERQERSWRAWVPYGKPKMIMAKNWPKFKTTVLANYSPNFRLLFNILNLFASSSTQLYPYYRYFNGSPFHGSLTLSVKKRSLNGHILTNIGTYKK